MEYIAEKNPDISVINVKMELIYFIVGRTRFAHFPKLSHCHMPKFAH